MNNILEIKNDATRKNYCAYIRKFETIDIEDIDDIVRQLKDYSLATQFNMCKALYIYSGKDEKIEKLMRDISEQYTGHIVEKKGEIGDIDWVEIVNKFYNIRNDGREQFMMFIWVMLCANYPRRFKDYRLIANVDKDGYNYFNKSTGIIHFRHFKNKESRTCGETDVHLKPIFQKWLQVYCMKYNVEGLLFDVNDRRLKYLINKYQIPTNNLNRKFQETRLLKDGVSPYEVSKKFNHSVRCQQVYYKHL
jgi:hypothetical protein